MKHYSKCVQAFSLNSFLKATNILLTKPHVINKRIWGNKILFRVLCNSYNQKMDMQNCFKRLDNVSPEHIKQFAIDVLKIFELEEVKESSMSDNVTEVLLTELLPKSYSVNKAYQLILISKTEAKVIFYDVTPENLHQNLCPNFSYTLMIENEAIVLNACCDEDSKAYQWLIKSLVQQFIKWGNEYENNVVTQNICTESLGLVSKNEYYHKYNELKLKYGKEMVKIWPECTDPVKFVYEDVAIATYLLLIWEDDKMNASKQTFVDLGCGNGLLVYILTKEGHNGIGIDVRKRKIWSMYSSDIQLEERTIVPSEVSLFPDADWIIGNHSDELTPWIPVLAARSSYKCNFFVLPCCAYNFDGSKYQRKNSNKSQYVEYLEYIKSLCEDCGFKIKMDRLKIPSTKRICLIGKGREYNTNEFNNYCNKIQTLIERDSKFQEDDKQNSMWIKDFKVRESVEKVKNCTRIDKTIIETIVTRISTYLLQDCSEDTQWSLGKSVEIHNLIHVVPQDELKKLKSECGGLQTLLKNNHHIFKVQSGKVQLRYPKTIDEVNHSAKNKNKSVKVKNKSCWFYNNHPRGCPLSDISCSFLHVKR